MRALLAVIIAGCLLSAPVRSAEPEPCDVPASLLSGDSELKRVAEAVKKEHRLQVAVVGTGSSILSGPNGTGGAYPARLEAILKQRLPGVEIKVTPHVKSRQTAADMSEALEKILIDDKPTLVVWQSGTIDAMRNVDPEEFRASLDEGVEMLQDGGADVVLMNMQYSPRTETMIAVGPYADNMRLVAQQRSVPLFDRLAIMRNWSEAGTFDLYAATKDYSMARRVHDCIGRALAAQIIDAAHLSTERAKTQN